MLDVSRIFEGETVCLSVCLSVRGRGEERGERGEWKSGGVVAGYWGQGEGSEGVREWSLDEVLVLKVGKTAMRCDAIRYDTTRYDAKLWIEHRRERVRESYGLAVPRSWTERTM
jgi:hypothetical protein